MTIHQRIGEAIASQGKITLVQALSQEESKVLSTCGFKKVGSLDVNGTLVEVYEVKITQVVNAPVKNPCKEITFPPNTRYYGDSWRDDYRLLSSGTPSNVQYRGSTTSLNDAAYNPLSILEDYNILPTKSGETHSFKLDVGDMSTEEHETYINMVKEEFAKSGRLNCDDSWTSYNQGYTGNSNSRNW